MTARTAKVPEAGMSLPEMKGFIRSHFEGSSIALPAETLPNFVNRSLETGIHFGQVLGSEPR